MTHIRKWKKVLALGCSHGRYACPKALDAILEFKRQFKPDTTIHLGDFVDVSSLRGGAKGSNDEFEPLPPDVEGGLDFLEKLEPQVVMLGNHEDRIIRFQKSPNAILKYCADTIMGDIYATCDKLGATLVGNWGNYQAYMLGGYRYMHGVYFNEMSARDHAEAFGNVVFAHTHRAAMMKGRRSDSPNGYCVGTLVDIHNMDYAKARRATLAWSQGFVWGYYCDDRSVLWLHEQPQNVDDWVLPV